MKRETKHSAGYDISVLETKIIEPKEFYVFETEANFKIKEDEFAMIVPRSSIGIKKNLMLMNTVGIIDSDFYPNTIKMALVNYGNEPVEIKSGDRVAQAIILKYETLENEETPTKERTGGIGSTN